MVQTLNPLQQLALLEALQKAAKKQCDPKSGDSLRADADAALMEAYAADGTDRRRIIINGVEVGTLSMTFTKASETDELRIIDADELVRWLQTTDEGTDVLRAVVQGNAATRSAMLTAAKGYGFLPDGCIVEHVVTPSRPKGTMLRVKEREVAQALQGELPAAVAGVLMPGEVE